jgi:hypothetical protein
MTKEGLQPGEDSYSRSGLRSQATKLGAIAPLLDKLRTIIIGNDYDIFFKKKKATYAIGIKKPEWRTDGKERQPETLPESRTSELSISEPCQTIEPSAGRKPATRAKNLCTYRRHTFWTGK